MVEYKPEEKQNYDCLYFHLIFFFANPLAISCNFMVEHSWFRRSCVMVFLNMGTFIPLKIWTLLFDTLIKQQFLTHLLFLFSVQYRLFPSNQ